MADALFDDIVVVLSNPYVTNEMCNGVEKVCEAGRNKGRAIFELLVGVYEQKVLQVGLK